ncbi:MAG: hypothetical protein QUV07_07865 [Cyanobium sp. CZS 25K]|nr:hypothetical protein [Cyanobium sp. CZS25K]
MLMMQDRNLNSPTYNRSTAVAIGLNITITYLACFQQLCQSWQRRQLQEQQWRLRPSRQHQFSA